MLTNSNSFKNILTLAVLIGTSWACLATSSSDGSVYGSFHAKSDCVSPTFDNNISVSNSVIISPAGIDFTSMGFPTSTLNTGSDSTGIVGGLNRVCKIALTSEHTTKTSYLYTCSDAGQFSCNIYLEEQ